MFKKKYLELFIKILIGGLLAWAIYRQVFARQDIDMLWKSLVAKFVYPNHLWLFMVLLLAPLNIAFEAMKGHELIKSFTSMKKWRVFKAVLSGITIAIFTPNRVGEYGGRILFVSPEHNWKAVIATVVGSLAQLLILLSFGLLGLMVFSNHFLFNIDMLVPLVKRIPFIQHFKRFFKHLLVLKNYHKQELWKALGFAFLRYATYSLQYYFLLKFYGIPISPFIGLAGIATIFFVQASIPLPPVMGLLARGEIALYVWGNFSEDQAAILAATFTLFVINIAVPALLGMVFIVQSNILKSLGYENGNEV